MRISPRLLVGMVVALVAVVAAVLTVTAYIGGPGNDTPAKADGTTASTTPRTSTEATPVATPTPTPTPTPSAPSTEDIVRRSGDAMANAGPVLVESRFWARKHATHEQGIEVREYDRRARRRLTDVPGNECSQSYVLDFAWWDNRHLGGLAHYDQESRATAPESFELLGETTIDGTEVWIVRYRFRMPSVEGPYPVEPTEWIAKDDYRLLRVESEIYDPFGPIGQEVHVFTEYRDTPAECTRAATLTRDDLEPRTTPRLESPWQ